MRVLDSTLRDGAQGEGISFSVNDKLDIISALDNLGVSYIEAGIPVASPKDREFFEAAKKLKLKHAKLVAFGSTCKKGLSPSEDEAFKELVYADTPVVSIFGKSDAKQVKEILKASQSENLRMIEHSCRYLKDRNKEVIFDAEHFFDGYKMNPDYALKTLSAAVKGGADVLCLCDTKGGTFPDEIFEITKNVCDKFKDTVIGIHTHDDSGMATANSVMSVKAGAKHLQGTYLGMGERTGNANLSAIIPNLQIKMGYDCIPDENLKLLTPTAVKIAEIANITLHKNMPFVGRSAFAHKAGMHADAVIKQQSSFEQIDPESVGNHRRFLMSEMTGKSAVLRLVQHIFPEVERSSPQIEKIVKELKEKESNGYQFEGAQTSLELIIRKAINPYKPFFNLISYKVLDELPYDNGHSATATIKLRVNDKIKIAASDGDGPVDAMDKALREAVTDFYPCIKKVRLMDYKVRVTEPKNATAAQVRVLITSTDGNEIWTTVGVSNDIIEASFAALVDSIEYKLLKEM